MVFSSHCAAFSSSGLTMAEQLTQSSGEAGQVREKDLEWEQYEEILANLLSFDEVRGKSLVDINKVRTARIIVIS